uniref:Uncharacterized protein n=1 Tax=Ralstonia solanacearum TaxID=305 RepID=A0A0S4WX21_RALSL|nr:protein of unknown function [Ralstonia solanacearum]CUV24157.1 protein of unknown function [Ralstonia solanacearum]CUV31329.1 protein of unknown function [Ralstonia solanacearum]CUV37044.1 protein of unknown function [Ralstonia solanacearum]CUV41689.1 protein of unknown function [Ralstonia solanacearum]
MRPGALAGHVVLRTRPRQQALGDRQAADGRVVVVAQEIEFGTPVAAGVIRPVDAHRAQFAVLAFGMLLDTAGQQGLEFIFGLQTASHRYLLANMQGWNRLTQGEFPHDPDDDVSGRYRVTPV